MKTKPSIVICGQVYEVGWLCLLNRLFGIKTICYVHGEEISTKRPKGFWSKIRKSFSEKVMNNAQGTIVVSNYTKDLILKEYDLSGEVVVLNNGVDLDTFYPIGKDPLLVNKYQLEGFFVLLTLSRLVPKKGIDLVIRSLPEILADDPKVKFLIGGTGLDFERLFNIAAECGVSDKVIFAGFIEDRDINPFMNLGDIFVMPNRDIDGDTEGFGLVFLQASACCLPVIGGKDGGTSDAVRDGKSGFLVDGRCKDDFVFRVKQLLRDDEQRNKIAHFGRNWAKNECGWKSRVDQFDKVIDELSSDFI